MIASLISVLGIADHVLVKYVYKVNALTAALYWYGRRAHVSAPLQQLEKNVKLTYEKIPGTQKVDHDRVVKKEQGIRSTKIWGPELK